MIIFRVEDINRDGPYIHVHSRDWRTIRHDDYSKWPTPIHEKLAIDYEHRCGFISLKQCFEWFFDEEERIGLNKYKFSISKYRIAKKHCIIGNKQLIFLPKYAKLISRINIVTQEEIYAKANRQSKKRTTMDERRRK